MVIRLVCVCVFAVAQELKQLEETEAHQEHNEVWKLS